MTAEPPLLVRSFKVGRRSVTLSVPRPKAGAPVALAAEWSPDLPRRLSKREWREYRAGRDALVADIAKAIGGTVLGVEL